MIRLDYQPLFGNPGDGGNRAKGGGASFEYREVDLFSRES